MLKIPPAAYGPNRDHLGELQEQMLIFLAHTTLSIWLHCLGKLLSASSVGSFIQIWASESAGKPQVFSALSLMLDCQILMPRFPRKRMRKVIVNPLENVMIFAKASKHRHLEIKALLKAGIRIYLDIWLSVRLGNTLYHLEEILIDLPLNALYSFLMFLFCSF